MEQGRRPNIPNGIICWDPGAVSPDSLALLLYLPQPHPMSRATHHHVPFQCIYRQIITDYPRPLRTKYRHAKPPRPALTDKKETALRGVLDPMLEQ
jgi:hypothetical protein